MNEKMRIGTLFSGIGAAEFALRRLNIPHEIVFACDNGELMLTEDDETIRRHLSTLQTAEERKAYIRSLIPKRVNFVKKSYMANYAINEADYYHDVRYMDATPYRDCVDLLVGGSPCQSFTLLGHQKGLEEARGTLFYDFARIVKETQPRAFIYENVRGLTQHDGGRTWAVVERVFHSLHYQIHQDILNAEEQGIPQTRRRIFVVGFREPVKEFIFPTPKKCAYTMQDFLQDHVAFGNFRSENGCLVLQKGGEEVDEKYYLSDKILPGILSAGTGGFYMEPEIDLPVARPLMSTMHKMHRAGEDNYVTTNGRIRRLTPRECLRLMGFTDDFVQVVSDTQMYRQAGNSVVVDVLMELIKKIRLALGDSKDEVVT